MWSDWIRVNRAELGRGAKIEVPWWLGAPSSEGFRALAIASPAGQVADWGLSLPDGSRIHVHEFKDGRRVVHRDEYDPDQGFGNMISHLVTETFVGIGVAVGIFIIMAKAD